MSHRRGWIVGVQAAAVAVLVLLVYVSLLRPEDRGPLRGIEAPGGGPQANVPVGPTGPDGPTGDRPGDRRREPGDRRREPGDRRRDGSPPFGGQNGSPGGGPLGLALGSTATGAGGLPPPGPVGTRPSTSSDDQYTDSAKALLNKVATGGAIAE